MISEMTESKKMPAPLSLGWLCLVLFILYIFIHILHLYWDKATFQAILRDAGFKELGGKEDYLN